MPVVMPNRAFLPTVNHRKDSVTFLQVSSSNKELKALLNLRRALAITLQASSSDRTPRCLVQTSPSSISKELAIIQRPSSREALKALLHPSSKTLKLLVHLINLREDMFHSLNSSSLKAFKVMFRIISSNKAFELLAHNNPNSVPNKGQAILRKPSTR